MTRPPSALLLLDLASDNPLDEDEARARIPEEERSTIVVYRATDHGAERSRNGSPEAWGGAASAIVQMVRAAREAGPSRRYHVAGRAALPLFAVLGNELSAWADVTFLHRRNTPVAWDALRLDSPAAPEGRPRFFRETTGLDRTVEDEGRVAVIVSTAPPRQGRHAEAFLRLQEEPVAGTVCLRAHLQTTTGPRPGILDAATFIDAARELEEALAAIPAVFPNQRGLCLFIDGPGPLAFLVGRALNANVLQSPAWVPNFSPMVGGGYYDGVELPHPPGTSVQTVRPPIEVAVLHADADEGFLRSFQSCLAPERRAGRVALWTRNSVPAGGDTEDAVREHLERAAVVVPLVSADLIGDDRLMGPLERLIREPPDGGRAVFPVTIRAYALDGTPFETVQVLPRSGQSIDSHRKPDEAWAEVRAELRRALTERAGAGP